MSFLSKLKTRITEVGDAVTEASKEILATEEVSKERMVICIACPELIHLTKSCKQCGCFMTAKTKLKTAECPLKKW
jgi:hypothetical protein